jgi:hypothetical protein
MAKRTITGSSTGSKTEINVDDAKFSFEEEYYKEFVELTKDGVVLFVDFSSNEDLNNTLEEEEKQERENYEKTIRNLATIYGNKKRHPKVRTREDLLRQRIVAPTLAFKENYNISARSSTKIEIRSNRRYPSKIYEWSDFSTKVGEYIDESTAAMDDLSDYVFDHSLICARTMVACANETIEQISLESNLNVLVQNGILYKKDISVETGVQGYPDFLYGSSDDKLTIICECKSTHNLLLPMKATECVEKYNTACEAMQTTGIRSTEWYHIVYPLIQLIGYLVDNSRRYGVLTSGTRTYFVGIFDDGTDSLPVVRISDAWFVGGKNYLRAWAYIQRLKDAEWDPSGIPSAWMQIG